MSKIFLLDTLAGCRRIEFSRYLAEKFSKYFNKKHSAPTLAQDFVIVDFSLLHKTDALQLTDLASLNILEQALTASHQQVNL
ncbi:MAG TPA: hypothetical protein PK915_01685 [Bacteroidales bacterium]|nr:hypothetical protein [Bacteroidales bacterium]